MESLDAFGTALMALAGAPFVAAAVLGIVALLWWMIVRGI